MKKLEYHPLSDYFPMLPESEFEQLKESIDAFGLLEPITLLDGMVLDGRNRYEACQQISVKPHFREYAPNEHEAIDFVVAANMRRRHLTEAQKAQIIIDVEGQPVPDYGAKRAQSSLDIKQGPPSQADLARKAGVAPWTISKVMEVQDDEELKQKLRTGQVGANTASRMRKQKVVDKAKIEPTWKGLYAKAPKAKDINFRLGLIIGGVIDWLGNEYGLDKIDAKGHTPLLLKRVDEAIAALERFKVALEELRDGKD